MTPDASPDGPFQVAALYRFAQFDDPEALRVPLRTLCLEEAIAGTLLLAGEGINGTVAGTEAGIARLIAHIRALPGCVELDVKYSTAPVMPFGKMKVRVKKEIVTLRAGDLDPAANAGIHVEPRDWNALIADPDTILIDTRNSYEVGIGTFEGAIDPGTKFFSDFPAWFDGLARDLKAEGREPKIAMFCTGGIRCEKSTAYAKQRGFEEVYHLKGGILKYLEEVPVADSRWQGDCFLFDERVAVTHGLAPGGHALCRKCGSPVRTEALDEHVENCAGNDDWQA